MEWAGAVGNQKCPEFASWIRPGSDKKKSRVSDLAANRLSSYLHRSIANPAT